MRSLIPKSLKQILYGFVRAFTRARLSCLPLSMQQAESWAETIRHYVAIYHGESFPIVRQLNFGLSMPVGVIDHIERHLRIEGDWDKPVTAVLQKVLKPGSTFLDIGANIGYFSLVASRLVGDTGTVVSVEPSLRALRKFTDNVHRNRCQNILLLSVGAGDSFQRLRLTLATESNIGGSSIMAAGGPQPQVSIAVAPLNELLRPLNIVPDLVKLDVEGFELYALRGHFEEQNLTCPVICEITAEFLQRNGQSVGEMFGMMSGRGYAAYRLDSDGASVRGTRLNMLDNFESSPQFDVLFVHESQAVPIAVFG